ncbi:MAG TPA: hypothetical protein VMX13_03645 [Sedimentisphaerales bacterium]|nr:hypothetical protein [Sedimentisphaerales bacterium]
MEARFKSFIVFYLIALTAACFAQEVSSPEPAAPADANAAGVPSFPYVAQINADDVYIRSGPGTNHYTCGKLSKADKVTVVGSLFGWSRIVPPPGSFSWIFSRYVKVEPDSPDAGIVIGNAVPVYVGAEDREPMHSDQMQLKLNKDEKVAILGPPQGEYYKIAPPTGAYLWVSTKHTQPLDSTEPMPPPSFTPVVVPGPATPNSVLLDDTKLQQFYELQKQMDAERAKPMAEQNYANIKKSLLEIANNPQAGKAARYAEFAVQQIGRCELALEVANAVRLQDEQLAQVRRNLASARSKRLAEIQDLGRFAVIGRLQTFTTYGPGHYRIVDESGNTVCYALPTGQTAQMNLDGYIGKKVGLVGTIEPHAETVGALVRFAKIVELD